VNESIIHSIMFFFLITDHPRRAYIQGVPEKNAQSLILQPYVKESCGFQQNVQKEKLFTGQWPVSEYSN